MATRTRVRTRKPRHDKPRAHVTILRGLLATLVFGFLALTALRLYNGVPTVNYVTQYVSVPTVGNLLAHDFVRIGGRRVGQVLSIDVGKDGNPRVELQLDPGLKLPEDTTVAVRANGLLGARYVALTPGDSKELLPAESTIKGGPDSYTFGLPEAVDTFDEDTRGGLRTTISELGAGVLGRGGALNGTLKELRIGAPQIQDVAQTILDRDGAAARLLPSFEAGFDALSPTKPYVRPGSQAVGDALQPFIVEREATRDTIAASPPALQAMAAGLPRGERLLASIRTFSEAAADTLPPAPSAFNGLNQLLDMAPPELRRFSPVLRRNRLPKGALHGPHQVVVEANRINIYPHLERLIDLLPRTLTEVGRRGCDITNFGAVMRSMTGFSQSIDGAAYKGPLGPAMAFRLIAVIGTIPGTFGIDDPTLKREGSNETPCKYLSEPYPQFNGTGGSYRKAGAR
jgi:phospholipid/cholesterol/gamma-HCH transport system substrate-binding protein